MLTVLDKELSNEEIVRHPLDSRSFTMGIAIMVIFQTVHLGVIVVASVKLAKQVRATREASA